MTKGRGKARKGRREHAPEGAADQESQRTDKPHRRGHNQPAARHVLEIGPHPIAHAVEDRKSAGAAGDARAGVADFRGGNELAAFPHRPQAEGEINVLVIAEIALIEPASIEKELSRIKCRRAARTEAFAFVRRGACWMTKA